MLECGSDFRRRLCGAGLFIVSLFPPLRDAEHVLAGHRLAFHEVPHGVKALVLIGVAEVCLGIPMHVDRAPVEAGHLRNDARGSLRGGEEFFGGDRRDAARRAVAGNAHLDSDGS